MIDSVPFINDVKEYSSSFTTYTMTTSDSSDMYYCSSSSSSVSNTLSANNSPEPESISETETTKRKLPIVAKSDVPKKQYQCPQCFKNFSRPSALQTHSYTHTSEKPFQCSSPSCGRRFSVVSNLRRHFKVHQKPAVGNKLSSEDRLCYVQRLIKSSNAIIASKQQQGQNSVSPNFGTQSQEKDISPVPQLQLDLSSIHRHYLILPAIQSNNNKQSISSPEDVNINPTLLEATTQPVMQQVNEVKGITYDNGNDFFLNSATMTLPDYWSGSQSSLIDENMGANQHFYSPYAIMEPTKESYMSNGQYNQSSSLSLYLGYEQDHNNETATF